MMENSNSIQDFPVFDYYFALIKTKDGRTGVVYLHVPEGEDPIADTKKKFPIVESLETGRKMTFEEFREEMEVIINMSQSMTNDRL